MKALEKYEAVIGLEIHIQLLTNTKAFSGDKAEFGAPPNTRTSPITLGHPGTLPKFNKRVLEYAVKLGLACNCEIHQYNEFARKNYFYADLPKGYQISQFSTPICTGGKLKFSTDDTTRSVGITRIHMEEDSGKSLHDQDPFYSLIDLNRAGVPLLELVTEPELRQPEEAYYFLKKIQKLVRYLEISDGNMEEGSLRCDANVSLRPNDEEEFGDKVEVKNMNSMRNVQNALLHEIQRQVKLLEQGETVHQDTRGFDPVKERTFAMRSKEMAHDYRYFPEPDLPPITISEETIDDIKEKMPPLPDELYQKYKEELNLPDYDAEVLTSEKDIALYFEEVIEHTQNFKAAANWVMGPVKSYLNDKAVSIDHFPLTAKTIAQIIQLIDDDKISNSKAEQDLFPALLDQPDASPEKLAEELNLIQDIDEEEIRQYIQEVLEEFPEKVEEYKSGKKGLLSMFMGQIMKRTKGKANPKVTNQLLQETLDDE